MAAFDKSLKYAAEDISPSAAALRAHVWLHKGMLAKMMGRGQTALECYDSILAARNQNVEVVEEDIEVVENILPYRREGSFYCLPHIDEGFKNGTWAKGETTARNERRFVTEMQQLNYQQMLQMQGMAGAPMQPPGS